MAKPVPGTIGWIDLTVPDAAAVRDFYAKVTGWSATDVDMGGYSDFCMVTPAGEAVAGVCHARGTNAGLPAVWLVYINVENIDASIAKCLDSGGEVISGPKSFGNQGRYCVIRDPAGAVCALYQGVS